MITSVGKLTFRMMPVIAGALIVTEIILTNQFAGSGSQMRSVDVDIDGLRQENALLTQQVASASSLSTIAAKASEMGLVEPSKNQYLAVTAELPVALNNPR